MVGSSHQVLCFQNGAERFVHLTDDLHTVIRQHIRQYTVPYDPVINNKRRNVRYGRLRFLLDSHLLRVQSLTTSTNWLPIHVFWSGLRMSIVINSNGPLAENSCRERRHLSAGLFRPSSQQSLKSYTRRSPCAASNSFFAYCSTCVFQKDVPLIVKEDMLVVTWEGTLNSPINGLHTCQGSIPVLIVLRVLAFLL